MSRKKRQGAVLDVEALRPLVINRAQRYHQQLPQQIRDRIELADWISIGIVFLCGPLAERAARCYDPSKSKLSTYVFRSIDNFYRGVAFDTCFTKYESKTVSLDELVESGRDQVTASQTVFMFDALRRVHDMHRAASHELVAFLDSHFFSCDHMGRYTIRGAAFLKMRKEFRTLAARFHITLQDYRIAIHVHHARQCSR